MEIKTIQDFNDALKNGSYAWPGGYPLFFIMKDGEALSYAAAHAEKLIIIDAIKDGYDKQWIPIAIEINWENSDLYCSHTNKQIESAYEE